MDKLPECYIFDIDSTLALRQDRKPFEWDKVDTDAPNKTIIDIYNALRAYKPEASFILITGRDEYSKEKTVTWLAQHGIVYNKLLMRPSNNRDLDANVKLQLFRKEVQSQYEVQAVFEDAPRCVELFKNFLGLNVLQVSVPNS